MAYDEIARGKPGIGNGGGYRATREQRRDGGKSWSHMQ